MREIQLNGYIDDDLEWGDEITPDALHETLYGSDGTQTDDVSIRLNSYGGSCNAATRMFDDIRAYPGKVHITISGTAASAATVMAQAADVLDMTPGSLFMIHDPATAAYGNEKDMEDAIAVLRACKESILNVYQLRSGLPRDQLGAMMKATTWLDATQVLECGLVDAIAERPAKGVQDSTFERKVSRADAEKGVQAWLDRQKLRNAAGRHFVENRDVIQINASCVVSTIDAQNTVSCTDLQCANISTGTHITAPAKTERRIEAADRQRRLSLLK